ncbi:MAG: tetratricopeptide repeat protein [Saprospiraceae bacterium]|nr:tetratricopeptide repeat protein [Saprospiraceae bacterium]
MAKKQTKKTIKKTTKKSTNNHLIFPALLIGALAFFIYSNTLGHQYTLDDFSAIKDNYVTQKGVEGIPTIFKTHYRYGYWNSPGELYRPFTLAMFALEWEISPDSPFIGHLMNVLFYALTGALLFVFLAKLFKGHSLLLPFFAALIYISHPVHVEVVANIKSRDEIIAFLGCLGAVFGLLNYWKNKKSKWLIISLLSYFIAMFSKENAITFLAIFPLIGYFFTKKSLKEILSICAIFLVPVVVYLLVRQGVIGNVLKAKETVALDNVLYATASGIGQFATAILLLGKYLVTLVFPHPLGSDFGYNQIPITGFLDWKVLLSGLVHLGLLGYAIKGLKDKKIESFAILFYLINFSIFSNIFIKIGSSFGDRFLYVASLGFAIGLTYVLMKLFKVNQVGKEQNLAKLFRQNIPFSSIMGVIILLFCAKTMSRNTVWYDSYSLYAADVKNAPNSAKLNYHFALETAKKGDAESNPQKKKEYYTVAKKHLNKALEIFPQYHDAYGRLGLTYYYEKNPNEAMKNYELAVKYKPNNATVYSNMGTLFFEQKNYQKAIESYEKAVNIDPRFVDGWRNLGSINAMSQKFPEAINAFRKALEIEPENAVLNFYLGQSLRDSGNVSEAQPYLEKAYRLDPSLRK